MNLAFFEHPRAPRPPALNTPAGQSDPQCLCARRSAATVDGGGADTACEARAPSARERWRLPTGLTEREMFNGAGVVYSTTKEDPL